MQDARCRLNKHHVSCIVDRVSCILMKVLFIGDIVGKVGRVATKALLPTIVNRYKIDLVIANGENAAGGFGLPEINISGRVFMPNIDCPFRTGKEEVEKLSSSTKMIIVDFHAEATSEKIAFGYFVDGKVSAVIGTHTHVQTADEKILPGGTAYITDVGMTGPYNSVIGI